VGKRKKKPRLGVPSPQVKKEPRVGVTPGAGKPSWLFQAMDLEGPWSCKRVGRDELLNIREHLASFESMTWTEIQQPAKSHFVETDRIIRDAFKRLQEIKQDDTDQLFSLRISAQCRLWGIRDGDTFKILWWDPKHEICPSEKRHT